MSTTTTIEWTEVTWNATTGCDRISMGCDNCYAMKLAKRLKAMGQPRYQLDGDPRTSGPGFGVAVHPEALIEPLHWRRPRKVFVNSMSDVVQSTVLFSIEGDEQQLLPHCQHPLKLPAATDTQAKGGLGSRPFADQR